MTDSKSTAGAPVDSAPESTMAAIVALVAQTYPDGANQFEAVHLAATTAWIVARFSVEIRTVPVSALPRHIGRFHLGEHRSGGERLCSHDHKVKAGHPLYWPQQLSQHDDSDPFCLAHAIEQVVSDNSWCERCGSAASGSEAVTAALQAGEAVLRGAGDGTYDEALDAIRLLIAALHTPPPVATVMDADEMLAWLATKPRLAVEHFGPVYGDDDDQPTGWRVMRESGPINDREWDEVARGVTPLVALVAARAALAPTPTPPAGGQ